MSLSWKDLYISALNTNSTIKSKYVNLVKGTSGCVNPGEVLAIMGPSEGGKSTLLNALAGYIPKNSITQGSITYNDNLRCKNTWFREIGYVDQDMCLLDELTVMETLYYHHRFKDSMIRKKGKNNNNEKICPNESIKNIIRDLELEKEEKKLIKKLSEAERKKTCIATALVNNPSIIFLDEPTSGLDAISGLKIVKILKKLAIEQQKIIILTIRKPSCEIFLMFDNLILLSEGNIMFQGKTDDVEKYYLDLKIKRDKEETIPVYILKICSKDFKLRNSNLFNNEDGIFRDKYVIKDINKMKKSNDAHLRFLPSPKHVLILLRRRFNILKREKFKYFLIMSKFLFFPLLLLLFINLFFNNIKKELSGIPPGEYLDIQICNLKINYIRDKIVRFSIILPSLLSIFISRVFLYCGNESFAPEFSHQYYSSASYYIYVVSFCLIQCLILAIIYCTSFMILFKNIDLHFPIIIYFFGFFSNLTIYMILPLLITNKTLINFFFLSLLFFTILSTNFSKSYLNFLQRKFLWLKYIDYFSPLLAILPSTYSSTLFGHKLFTNNNERMPGIFEDLGYILDFLKSIPLKIRIPFLYVILSSLFFIYLILGCLLMERRINLETRLVTE